MHILFLNPFHGGSHAAVAEGYARHSRHDVELLALPIAGGWRWRMRGAAVTFARMLHEQSVVSSPSSDVADHQPQTTDHTHPFTPSSYDLILATDMLDLATFLGLTRDLTAGVPTAVYFHENQLTYPLPPGRARDLAFPWINYTSALAAGTLFFNSDFHRRAFLGALPGLIGRYHDHQELGLIGVIANKAQVLPPGIDLARLDPPTDDREILGKHRTDEPNTENKESHPVTLSSCHRVIVSSPPPVILWNGRWEYDKNPAAFFAALGALEAQDIDFRLIVLGEHVDPGEPSFAAARERFGPRALAWGYAPDAVVYGDLLRRADIVVSTAIQEFFGVGVIEAMYCGCVPILPRRLSYPEILPPEHHAACLYDGPDDLVGRLAAAIRDLPALKARGFHDIAAQYGWRHMALRFDVALEHVADQRR